MYTVGTYQGKVHTRLLLIHLRTYTYIPMYLPLEWMAVSEYRVVRSYSILGTCIHSYLLADLCAC